MRKNPTPIETISILVYLYYFISCYSPLPHSTWQFVLKTNKTEKEKKTTKSIGMPSYNHATFYLLFIAYVLSLAWNFTGCSPLT